MNSTDKILTKEQILGNWKKFLKYLENWSDSRKDAIYNFYQTNDTSACTLPYYFINTEKGSNIGDFVRFKLSLIKDLIHLFDKLKEPEWKTEYEKYIFNSVLFVVFTYDIGKINSEGYEMYVPDEMNKGSFKYNEDLRYMRYNERSIFLLNNMSVHMSEEEMITILNSDFVFNCGYAFKKNCIHKAENNIFRIFNVCLLNTYIKFI
ncbi:MAG: hypothetical protein IRZ03_15995 [Acidobacterium ailaaui]|nr:hypothetical protein [Pseudacidobacterium ailaaui]